MKLKGSKSPLPLVWETLSNRSLLPLQRKGSSSKTLYERDNVEKHSRWKKRSLECKVMGCELVFSFEWRITVMTPSQKPDLLEVAVKCDLGSGREVLKRQMFVIALGDGQGFSSAELKYSWWKMRNIYEELYLLICKCFPVKILLTVPFPSVLTQRSVLSSSPVKSLYYSTLYVLLLIHIGILF